MKIFKLNSKSFLESHGGGGPQVGEVTCGGLPHLTCKRDQIKMRDYNGQVGYLTYLGSPTSM